MKESHVPQGVPHSESSQLANLSWTLVHNDRIGFAIDPARFIFGKTQTVISSTRYTSFSLLVVAKRHVDIAVQHSEVDLFT